MEKKSKLIVGVFMAWAVLACSLWGITSSWSDLSTIAYLVAFVLSLVSTFKLSKKWDAMKNEERK